MALRMVGCSNMTRTDSGGGGGRAAATSMEAQKTAKGAKTGNSGGLCRLDTCLRRQPVPVRQRGGVPHERAQEDKCMLTDRARMLPLTAWLDASIRHNSEGKVCRVPTGCL